jgi:hypothetical protein
MSAAPGTGFITRCAFSFSSYSALSPAWRLLATRWSCPSGARESVMNRRAGSSNSMWSARSSVVRVTRETREITTIPRMKKAEMVIPSGFSMTLAISAYSSTRVRTPNPTADAWRRRRIAEMVTATAPETIIARIPVA